MIEEINEQKENSIQRKYCQKAISKHLLLVFSILNESKIGCFHPEGQHHHQESNEGVKLRDHSIVTRLHEHVGVQRNEQVVERSSQNCGKPIDGCLPQQLLEWIQEINF